MSFIDNGGNMTMPVQPMGGYGGGNGFWGDGSFWIIILFLFAFMGNGWGGGFGNGGGFMNGDMQRGFDQQAVMSGISGINTSLAGAEVSRCNSQANILAAMNNNVNNLMNSMNTLAMNQQNCCCENRAATADVKYTVANEAAATRSNTDAKVQMVMDKLCQLELDGIKQNYENRISGMANTIDNLRSELANARSDASQTAQTAAILANNAAQTQALEQYLNPAPIPAYMVQNPNCCSIPNYGGCGCGVA